MSDAMDDNATLSTDYDAYPERVPEFANEDELREFWSVHDSSPYFEQMEDMTHQPLPGLRIGLGVARGAEGTPAALPDWVTRATPATATENVVRLSGTDHKGASEGAVSPFS